MSTTNVPGMMLPTQKGMVGANPKDSSIQTMNNMNQKQASLSNAVGGKKKSKKRTMRRGGAANSTIPVPQYQMQYQVQNGPGQDPNSQIQQNAQISTQGAANSAMDKYATQKGGNPNWHWGCKSGGSRKPRSLKMRKTIRSKSYKKKTTRRKSSKRKSSKRKSYNKK